jgi:RND family efflux transporter MFP subunit
VLASIVQHDPIYVNFSISEQDALRVRAELMRRGVTFSDLKTVTVEFGLQSETGYPHKGTIDYVAPTINQTTGTLSGRAIFNNNNRVLLPGYFVRVRIPGPERNVLLIPDVALGSDQGGRYVLVASKDNVVEQRKVEIGPRVDTLRVIESGITVEDRVIVGGLLRAIPGQKVDPQHSADRPAQAGAR